MGSGPSLSSGRRKTCSRFLEGPPRATEHHVSLVISSGCHRDTLDLWWRLDKGSRVPE